MTRAGLRPAPTGDPVVSVAVRSRASPSSLSARSQRDGPIDLNLLEPEHLTAAAPKWHGALG